VRRKATETDVLSDLEIADVEALLQTAAEGFAGRENPFNGLDCARGSAMVLRADARIGQLEIPTIEPAAKRSADRHLPEPFAVHAIGDRGQPGDVGSVIGPQKLLRGPIGREIRAAGADPVARSVLQEIGERRRCCGEQSPRGYRGKQAEA